MARKFLAIVVCVLVLLSVQIRSSAGTEVQKTPLASDEQLSLASMDGGSLDGIAAGQEKAPKDKSGAVVGAIFLVLFVGAVIGWAVAGF